MVGPLKQILSPSLLHIVMYWAQPLEEVLLYPSLLHIFDVLDTALGRGALPFGPTAPFLLHLPSPGGAVGCGGGGEIIFLLGTGGAPSTLGFEKEQVLVPFFLLYFAYSTWHWVTLLLLLTESQQTCAFLFVLYTVEG